MPIEDSVWKFIDGELSHAEMVNMERLIYSDPTVRTVYQQHLLIQQCLCALGSPDAVALDAAG